MPHGRPPTSLQIAGQNTIFRTLRKKNTSEKDQKYSFQQKSQKLSSEDP